MFPVIAFIFMTFFVYGYLFQLVEGPPLGWKDRVLFVLSFGCLLVLGADLFGTY